MNKEKIDILIDKLVLNKISPQEKVELNSLLDQTPKLKNEVKFRKEINKSMEYLGNEDLRKLLSKIHEEEFERNGVKKWAIWKYALIGLLTAVLTIAVFQMLKPSNTPSGEAYAEYFSPYTASTERGEDEEKVILTFKSLYSSSNYLDALKTIKPILASQKNEIKLMAGISALETDDFTLATQLFEDVLSTKDYFYQDHANWYLGLTYLKQNKVEEARGRLETLKKNPKADHHTEASDLLDKI